MNYHTYVIAFDGNWIAVVSACNETQALKKVKDANPEMIDETWSLEIRRVPPGQMLHLGPDGPGDPF